MRIIIDDENDNAPIFTLSDYEGRITENSPSGTEIALTDPIAASDKDEGTNRDFTFALQGEGSGLFNIDPLTGRVFFVGIDNKTLDRETRANYELQVIATDSGKYMLKLFINFHILFYVFLYFVLRYFYLLDYQTFKYYDEIKSDADNLLFLLRHSGSFVFVTSFCFSVFLC